MLSFVTATEMFRENAFGLREGGGRRVYSGGGVPERVEEATDRVFFASGARRRDVAGR